MVNCMVSVRRFVSANVCMRSFSSRGMRNDIGAGILASGGALAILMQGTIKTGHLRLDQALMPILVALTIITGHLTTSAARERKPLSALGFAAVFSIGTLLTIYTSVGSQAKMAGAETATASAAKQSRQRIESQMARVEAERTKASNMLAAAQRKLAKECASGRGSRCRGRQATVAVYQAAVKGHNADLARLNGQLDTLAPAPVTGARVGRMAAVLAIFAADEVKARARYERAFMLFEPFAYSLFLELGALVAFGFGFGHARKAKMKRAMKRAPTTPRPSKRRSRKNANVIAFVTAHKANTGERPSIKDVQAAFPGLGRSTAARYAATSV